MLTSEFRYVKDVKNVELFFVIFSIQKKSSKKIKCYYACIDLLKLAVIIYVWCSEVRRQT
jgi:hypothetical protein